MNKNIYVVVAGTPWMWKGSLLQPALPLCLSLLAGDRTAWRSTPGCFSTNGDGETSSCLSQSPSATAVVILSVWSLGR